MARAKEVIDLISSVIVLVWLVVGCPALAWWTYKQHRRLDADGAKLSRELAESVNRWREAANNEKAN